MKTQLLTIDREGGITALLRSRKSGIDLRDLGHAEVERSSLIEFYEPSQQFCIRILHGAFAEYPMASDWQAWAPAFDIVLAASLPDDNPTAQPYFNTYEEAVAAEVALIEGARSRLGPTVATPGEHRGVAHEIEMATAAFEAAWYARQDR